MQKCFFWSTSVQVDTSSGDASKARIYIGPQLYDTGANLIPVTLSFVDVNGSHLPDLMLHLQDTRLVSINMNGGFRAAISSEIQAAEHYLQHQRQ